jgi:hypothetical protein
LIRPLRCAADYETSIETSGRAVFKIANAVAQLLGGGDSRVAARI